MVHEQAVQAAVDSRRMKELESLLAHEALTHETSDRQLLESSKLRQMTRHQGQWSSSSKHLDAREAAAHAAARHAPEYHADTDTSPGAHGIDWSAEAEMDGVLAKYAEEGAARGHKGK